MTTISAIGVGPATRVCAGIMVIIGLIAGILYSFGGAIYDALVTLNWLHPASSGAWSTTGLGAGTALAFLALIGMPILFGVCGLIGGAVGALLYNIVARRIGGVELHLDQDR